MTNNRFIDNIVIASACRTPIGNFGGSFLNVSAASLGGIVIKESIKRAGLEVSNVDEVYMGCVLQSGLGQNVARQSSIIAGVPFEVPSTTINMLCGSGLKTVCVASQSIMSGNNEIIVAGGTENMSQAPYLQHEIRWGTKMGNVKLIDSILHDALTDVYNHYHMGITAENIAKTYGISREEQDIFANLSQEKAGKSQTENIFKDEIVPIEVNGKENGFKVVELDEYIRFGTTIDNLSKLRPAFKKDGTVTAGNSSGINDGAAALVIMSGEKAKKLGVKPLAKILSYASTGIDPSIMGMGPVMACKKALQNANLTIDAIGLVELNEAFAVQAIAVIRKLGLNSQRVNVNGGAISIGHPVGASGARILVTLIFELIRRRERYGMATLCVGGGMGVAMIIENMHFRREDNN